MAVAAWMHHVEGDGFGGWSHALEAGIVFAGLLLSGPGRWAIEIRRRSSSP
jgi:putative oxidoreductase